MLVDLLPRYSVLTFYPDPDSTPDLGSELSPDFRLSAIRRKTTIYDVTAF